MDLGVPNELLDIALAATRDIRKRSQDVSVHRRQCTQLAQRCAELVNALREQEDSLGDSKLREAVDELEDVLIKIRKRVIEWANLSRVKSFMRQEQVATDIEAFNGLLDTHVLKFQMVTSIELHRQQRKLDLYRQNDQEEVKDMLHKIIRSVEDLSTAVGMRDDVPKLMQTIQEELKDEEPGTEEYQALRGGLDTLHVKTGILPPLTDLTGQVTKLGEHPVAEGGTADIYEGRWVGDEKVMLKAIRHVESGSAIRRFEHEVDIWRRLEHKNILRFYGICYIGPRLFAVAPWAEGGNLQTFIKKNLECDRMRLLSEVASGLKYLHTFRPMIVHGDLRAANVVVSASEEALLTDFGLSKIVAEEEGMDVASTSLENAGSSRWMAPELFQVDTSTSSSGVTSASDVWSFGMLCLEVLTGQPPFYPKHRIDGQVIATLIQGNLPERPEPQEAMYQRGLSDEMWKLMNRCWGWKPSARPEMRNLASEVRKLHTEYLRKYGVASLAGNTLGISQAMSLFDNSVWNSRTDLHNLASLLPTPPTSSGMSSSPGSSRIGQGLLSDSPRALNPELPRTPTTPYVPATSAVPIPRTTSGRPEITTQSLHGLNPGSSPDSGPSWLRSSFDRSPTILRVPQYRHRAGSVLSHESEIAGPHPEGHAIINYDEQGNVLTGNLEGLVTRLLRSTHAAVMDKEFRECFITVYRGFARVDDLWPMLVDRYKSDMNMVITAYSPYIQKEQAKLSDSMLAILNDWLDLQAVEPKDRDFLLQILEFINEKFSNEPLDENWSRLQEKLRGHLITLNQPASRTLSAAAGRMKWSDLNPAVVAKQLMRIESDLFRRILPSDFAARLKNIADEELLNIPRFFKNNYRVEDWCLSLILFIDANEIEKRAQVITFLKRVAEESLKIRSFSSAHAIMSALTHVHVNGLEYTWRLVDRRVKEGLKQMSQLLSDTDKYKEALNSNLQLPSVPILSVHLRDLSRAYKEMQTQVVVDGEELVNFQKFTEVWKSIKELMKYQSPQPNITRDPMTAGYLEHAFAQIDENSGLQDELKARSEELHRKEVRDFNLRRLGMEDAGFRSPRRK
ncbi:Rap guanine nucleotide exchange factor [Rhizoctonia solani]|uniref:Rap guanine nucleotide exchange factor n=1 Tax=Rhizoctonia solani TaxID=456999 RepID=A0A0K6G912_9AGAM|nr:Rap guanine nucleotide exchange factor [Rhizoctonia solani]